MEAQHNTITDVVIIGAGLSGIGAAFHIQDKCPNKSYQVLEARESMGGTWDLFRYPGIRSDSDMYTLGFSFNPWTSSQTLADGPSILQYIKDTAAKFGITPLFQGSPLESGHFQGSPLESQHPSGPIRCAIPLKYLAKSLAGNT